MLQYCILVIAFLAIGGFYPAFWTSALGYFPSFVHFTFLLIVWAVLLLVKQKKLYQLSHNFNVFYGIIIAYYVLRIILVGDLIEQAIAIIRLLVFYVAVLLAKNSFVGKYFMRLFTKWNILMLSLTVIGLVLFYVGVLQPIGDVYMGSDSQKKMLNYIFFFVKVHESFDESLSLLFIRPAGYYDEPGSFAYVLVLLLVYNKLHWNNRKLEFVIMIGGLFLLSMAFYFSVVLYLFLFYVNRKNLMPFISLMLFLCVLIWLISHVNVDVKEFLYRKTIERTADIIDGTDKSRNFSESFIAFRDNFFFGSTSQSLNKNYPSATPETIWYFMALNGIWGMLVLFSPFIYLLFISLKYKRITCIKLLLIIFFNFLQRPYYLEPLYLILLYFTFWEREYDVCHKKVSVNGI